MKILAIRGRNLASLPRFAVSFETDPLRRAGVFLIAGPTGSGKSTLLDALCLALYDKTPRLVSSEFDKGLKVGYQDDHIDLRLPAGDPRSLLRRGAVTGWAQVDFLVRGKGRFQATWSVRRARFQPDGRMQEVRIELKNLDDGTVLSSDRKTETLKLIEELIGLSFAQFCRSVLLAQGEFAQFLRLRGDERADLLEKMTGTAIYAQLSRRAFERSQQEKDAHLKLEAQRLGPGSLSEPERVAEAARLQALASERERLEAQGAELRLRELRLRDLQQRREALQQAERALREAEEQVPHSVARRARLARLQAAHALRPLHDEALRAAREHAALLEQVAQARLRCERAAEVRAQVQAQSDEAEAILRQLRRAQEQAAPLLQSARELELREQHSEEQRAQAARVASEAGRALTLLRGELQSREKQLLQSEEARDALLRWLDEHRAVAPLLPTQAQSLDVLAQYRQELEEEAQQHKRGEALTRRREQARRRFDQLKDALHEPRRERVVREEELQVQRQALLAHREAHPPERLRQEREAAAFGVSVLERLEELSRQGLRLRQRSAEQRARRVTHEAEIAAHAQHGAQAQGVIADLVPREQEAARDLHIAREAERLAARRGELLTPGRPCPLCGGLDHPAAREHVPPGSLVERINAELVALRRDLEAARERQQQADKARHAAERMLAMLDQDLRDKDKEQREREEAFTRAAAPLCRLPSLALTAPPPGLFAPETGPWLQQQQQRLLEQQQQALAAEEAAAVLAQAVEGAQRSLDEARAQVDKLSDEQARCEAALKEAEGGLLAVSELLERGRRKRQNLLDLLAQPLRDLEGWHERLHEGPLAFQQWLEGELAAYAQRFQQADKASARARELATSLAQLRDEDQRRAREHQTLVTAQRQADLAREALRAEREALCQSPAAVAFSQLQLDGPGAHSGAAAAPRLAIGRRPAAEVEQELRRSVQRGERGAQEVQQRLQAALTEQAGAEESAQARVERLQAAQDTAAQGEQRLAAALQQQPSTDGSSPLTLAELRELLQVDDSERWRLQRDLQSFEEQRAQAAAAVRDRRARLSEVEGAQRSAAQPDQPQADPGAWDAPGYVEARLRDLAAVLNQTLQRQASAAEEYGAAAERLRKDSEQRERSSALVPQIEVQRLRSAAWNELSNLIGSADGKKLRKFAQGLTLDALLTEANKHLLRLRPRYQLERVPGFDMDLQIIDRDLGDEVRSCATLSGGETFLASLALALGLSSLSARSVPLESLFIDEGFGTLDEESLIQALDMLEELHGDGRQVGIISHVHDLTERISHQIIIEPRPPGTSRVLLREGGRLVNSAAYDDDLEDDPADGALPVRKPRRAPARRAKAAPGAALPDDAAEIS